MKRKTFISKLGIMFALIFSFLFSVFEPMYVKAANGNVVTGQDYVYLTNIDENNDVITFTTSSTYNILEIIYEICYTKGNVKEGDLITTQALKKIDSTTYSFDIASEVIGVKIHKIRYTATSDEHTPAKMTQGKNTWGDMSADRKKNYIEVTTDKLERFLNADQLPDSVSYTNAGTAIFYFNLDTVIDSIEKLEFEYAIRTEEKDCWWCKPYETIKTYKQIVDTNAKVLSEDFHRTMEQYVNGKITFEELNNKLLYLQQTNTEYRTAFGKNTNGNGYDWYLQPLLDVGLESKDKGILGWGYKHEYLQEVALIKMSYYFNGEYFEDVPVLDEDTGWIDYIPEANWWDKLMSWFDHNFNIFTAIVVIAIVIIIILLINGLLRLFRLDKDSRDKRKMRKDLRELQEIQMANMKNQLLSYKHDKKNSGSKYSNVKRYKK